MKTIKLKQPVKLAILLTSVFIMQSCSHFKRVPINEASQAPKKNTKIVKTSLPPKFENFDRKPYANESFIVANMIAVVQPELDEKVRDSIATQISQAIKKHKIEPQIIVAIIDTESDFKADKVSTTGDLSIAQINVEVWNKEFIRMKKSPMQKTKILKDQQYALIRMAEILSILKKRHEKNDRRWYARYHSNTTKYKRDYLHKLEVRLKMLATTKNLTIRVAETALRPNKS